MAAIASGAFTLRYQPIVELGSGTMVGVEALVRWPHPDLGVLTPHQFLPLLRRNGLMGAVTDLVLEQAARDAAAAGLTRVNISLDTVDRATFERVTRRDRVDGVLVDHAQPPISIKEKLVSRIKVMSRMDIAEKRVPQDGRISMRIGGRAVDVLLLKTHLHEGGQDVFRGGVLGNGRVLAQP